jgi:two-component system nitrate/nitrite response regulator NarL
MGAVLDSDASPVRYTLVAEDPLARGALSRALAEQGDGIVLLAAGTLAEVESSRSEVAPDVVLWDVGLRDVAPAPLLAALRAVARGLTVFEPALAALRATPRGATAPSAPEGLTPREREVLGLLAEGLSNKAIADRLDISEHTAKFHVNAVLTKLGVQRRTEAVVRAARLGLVTL